MAIALCKYTCVGCKYSCKVALHTDKIPIGCVLFIGNTMTKPKWVKINNEDVAIDFSTLKISSRLRG